MKRFFQHGSRQFFIWILSLAILTSCSRNLSKLSAVKNDKNVDSVALVPAALPVARRIAIDTLKYPINKSYSSLANSYYKQRVGDKTTQFYRDHGFQTKWLYDNAPGNLYQTVVETLRNSWQYGLLPDDYDVNTIEERFQTLYKTGSPDAAEIAALDIHITEMYFLFTTHLIEGKVRNVGSSKYVWKKPAKTYSPADIATLLQATSPDQLLTAITSLQPANEQYAKLQKALDHYRLLEQAAPKSFPSIIVTGKVKPQERHAAIPLIRKKLEMTDLKVYPMLYDSAAGVLDSTVYDQTLVDAVKSFQMRHGLEADGVIGDKTLKFLNQSFREKAEVIALNMERMRWSDQNYGDNYITVNVPEYKMRVYENHKQELEMKVIVGAASKATPIFSDELEHIVFSPTWTVPVSIIKEEIIPHLKQNPAYYSEKNYTFYKNDVVIDPASELWTAEDVNPYQYRVVQNPGPDNSLGLVKFIMPNNMSVYLHDTPNHRLFSKDYRALSHGCVRLSEPAKFAAYLLRDQKGWTPERISKAMNDSTPSTVHLKKRYEVHLEYRTAWVDEAGQVNFREDIYGHDRTQLAQLRPVAATSTFMGM